ncbi:MAG: 1-acyl-sn-glycerol-3-phosphate acyltransferase [Treponema sp.]|jgi:1-acyl-sn-glycerol-3-phosphate acyltransferase|nr:1-acyl-sn-glycerol-3-phosphate acyltransferase [Treponema sp.]
MILTIFAFAYVILTAVFLFPFGLIATALSLLGLRKLMAFAIYKIAQVWALILIRLTGCKVAVAGRENIPRDGGVCFVCNHDGYFDIVLLLAYCGRPIGFIAKKELLFLPFINVWIYMIGGLYIDRGATRKAVSTIHKGVRRIQSGGGMIIFPEGHRSKGRGLLPFHPGSLKLATMAEAPIVPVAMRGSYDVFEKTGLVASSSITLIFCPPVLTADLPSSDRKLILSDKIFSVIKEQLEGA